ncbi:GSCFA domain-containing protein [Fulvivirgaceae bacterium LMO-SS25]
MKSTKEFILSTPVSINPSDDKLNHNQQIISLGSCFAETMGSRLANSKFNVLANPFGVIYHPSAIAHLLDLSLNPSKSIEDGFDQHNGIHFHYDFHSSLSQDSKAKLDLTLEKTLNNTHEALEKADWLILTFGTAFRYYLKTEKRPVANCHKMPAKLFDKRLSFGGEMLEDLNRILHSIRMQRPNLNVIVTVSPVRHTKDGMAENMMSKSLLRVLCGQLAKENSFVHYFPSYEIMLDELRDYRYYKSDLIHPTELAEDIIWLRFAQCYFSSKTIDLISRLESIQQDLSHRIMQPKSEAAPKFLNALENKIRQFPISLPEEEKQLAEKRLEIARDSPPD